MGIFDFLLFDSHIFDTGAVAVEQPFDWAPPLDMATSTIIGQALRFMRLAPVARHDPGSELLPALAEAFDLATDDLLASADWSFASALAVLPPVHLPSGVASDDRLGSTARLPGDLLALREVWPAGSAWRIDSGWLRHDAPAAVTIRYTARVTREAALPASVRTALALAIALQLAGRWAGSGADPEVLADAAARALKQAMRNDSRQAATSPWSEPATGGLVYGSDDDWALEAVA